MAQFVKLAGAGLEKLREMNPRLVSYNVEMTEVTGGTFWKAYTDAQVDGTEEFPVIRDWNGTIPSIPPIPALSSWRRNWDRLGFVFPALGRIKPTMILTVIPAARCRKASKIC